MATDSTGFRDEPIVNGEIRRHESHPHAVSVAGILHKPMCRSKQMILMRMWIGERLCREKAGEEDPP
jgi:hypothetical protein